MKRILVLSTASSVENIEILHGFVNALNDHSDGAFTCEAVSYTELEFHLGIDGFDVKLIESGMSVLEYDFVYFKSFIGYIEQAVALAHLLDKKGVPFFCSELLTQLTTTKLAQYAILAVNELPLPRTVYIHRDRLLQSFDTLAGSLQLPFVMKAVDGKGGNKNFLVETKEEFDEITGSNPTIDFIFQEFIANSGDLRVLIVNTEIQLVIHRSRADDSTHLNNTSQGASAKLLDVSMLSEENQSLCMKAAKVLRREIAGVDIMFEETTEKAYILEVNASPQVGSGAFMPEKIKVYVDFFSNL